MSSSVRRELRCLDERRAAALASLCETIVPGSARVGSEVYIDAVLAKAPPPVRDAALAAIDTLAPHAGGGEEALRPLAGTPEFQMIRAMACEAYYSDFVAPGAEGPGAWHEIGFEFPLASKYVKDWSYLGVSGA
jgi:hypothetical protein